MADYILRRRRDFVFAIEDAPDKTFTIPALTSLSFEDGKLMSQINAETDIVKRGKLIEGFLLKYAPGLKDLGVSGMELYEIFNAYGQAVGRNQMGES